MGKGTNSALANTSTRMSEQLEVSQAGGEVRRGGEAPQVEATVAERAHYLMTTNNNRNCGWRCG